MAHVIEHQRVCHNPQSIGCDLNSKLLQYFIQNEFMREKNCSNCCHAPAHTTIEQSIKKVSESALPELEASAPSENIDCKSSGKQGDSKQSVMMITKCPHTDRKHYAKNMCSSCYRKFGRSQKAWNCEHTDRLNYSMGMCQTCYLSDYHQRTKGRRRRNKAILKALKKGQSIPEEL